MNILERANNEKQAATLAQQQREASSNKHSQNQQGNSKSLTPRKSREGRSRSQEWPDVPDIGKIHENNPEILAQKILETGRQIEAGRIPNNRSNVNNNSNINNNNSNNNNSNSNNTRTRLPQASLSFSSASSISSSQTQINHKDTNNRVQEPPRVANFEDRLKSIITSVLNEDQQNRSKQQQQMQLQIQMQQHQNEPERKRASLTNISTPDYAQVNNIFVVNCTNFIMTC